MNLDVLILSKMMLLSGGRKFSCQHTAADGGRQKALGPLIGC
jgi:hypothetical protein